MFLIPSQVSPDATPVATVQCTDTGNQRVFSGVSPNGVTVQFDGQQVTPVAQRRLAAASVLLTGLAVAMGVVSWHAQYTFIFSVKHEQAASALEALGLDCGAVVFSILGVALARLGRRAVIERALVCICAAGSCAMDAARADLASPRSVAAFVMPPVLFAITSDRLVSVIRRKTTLARLVASRLGARHIERDEFGDDEAFGFAALVAAAVEGADRRWVFDGAPYNAEALVYPHADALVALDYPRRVVWVSPEVGGIARPARGRTSSSARLQGSVRRREGRDVAAAVQVSPCW